jgi:hypothetical protein
MLENTLYRQNGGRVPRHRKSSQPNQHAGNTVGNKASNAPNNPNRTIEKYLQLNLRLVIESG